MEVAIVTIEPMNRAFSLAGTFRAFSAIDTAPVSPGAMPQAFSFRAFGAESRRTNRSIYDITLMSLTVGLLRRSNHVFGFGTFVQLKAIAIAPLYFIEELQFFVVLKIYAHRIRVLLDH